MYKRQALNYITIVCAISTIGMAIYTIHSKKDVVLCTIMLLITLVVHVISKHYQEKDSKLTKEDQELLSKLAKKRGRGNFLIEKDKK